jgi:phosphoribosylamine--glycine ligase
MHVLLVGGGGREHALAWRVCQSPALSRLSVTHANPGFPAEATIASGDLVTWASEQGVDLVIVGPETPLAEGLVDRLQAHGIPAFGPSQAAAQLEASKAFAKSFMDRHGIPTAGWSVHTDAAEAHAAITGPCVVKADGLAAGKGVIIAHEPEEAHAAVDAIFGGRFGDAGSRVVIEELMTGPECSFLAICDGERALPLLPCRDHKRRFEAGTGPNTGGMGAICPPPDVDPALVERVRREVLQPVVDGMRAEGSPFRGLLYAGLMLTPTGPRVLEFNVRFGDPECQPLMAMLDMDLLPVLHTAATGSLEGIELRWHVPSAAPSPSLWPSKAISTKPRR